MVREIFYAASILTITIAPAQAVSAFATGTGAFNSVVGGTSYGQFNDAGAAQQQATDACNKGVPSGSGCQVVAIFSNTCFAIAVDVSGYASSNGLVQNPDLQTARQRAIAECKGAGGVTCRMLSSYCDDGTVAQRETPAAPSGSPPQIDSRLPQGSGGPTAGDAGAACRQFPNMCGYKQ